MMPDDHTHNIITIRELFDREWTAHQRQHDEQSVALDRARDEVNRRLEEMNDLRQQITDERGDFLTRHEYDAKHEALIERISALERGDFMRRSEYEAKQKPVDERVSLLEHANANLQGRMWAVGALFVLIQVVIRFLPNLGGG